MDSFRSTSSPFNSNKVLSTTVIILNSILALLSIISIATRGLFLSDDNLFQAALGVFIFIIFILEFVIFLVWVNYCNKNLTALDISVKEYSSGWAVGWFFVPVACLFKPFSVMREIWEGSSKIVIRSNGIDYTRNEPSGFVAIWWTMWVISNLLGQIVFRMNMRSNILDASSAAVIELISDLADAASYILTAILVYKITNLQSEKYRSIVAQQQEKLEFDNMNMY